MMEAEISLALPDNWITEVYETFPSVIKVLDSKLVEDSKVRDLVEIHVENEEDLPKVIETVKSNPKLSNVDVSQIEGGKVLAAFSTDECAACRMLAGTECFLSHSTTTKTGRLNWTLLVTEKRALQSLMTGLNSVGAEPKLVKLTDINDSDSLTARQEQITRMAFERGYFDFPRKTGLRELARSFDISTSTLSEILRKGQRRIMLSYFKEHKPF